MEGRVDRGRQQRVTKTTTLGHEVEGLQSFLENGKWHVSKVLTVGHA